MTPEEQSLIDQKLKEVAEILYRNTPSRELATFKTIELSVRKHLLTEVSPKIGKFFRRTRRDKSRKRAKSKNLHR